ncbi:response regulator transcription factor [Novosphingobium lentum]|uniref:response regulator transcription factor n=1 Tax=Novosphingobium lentum TaxID=145287 RepID=UPI0014701BC4|nr:response regulator transcription factor [Novosphingobium lentum]
MKRLLIADDHPICTAALTMAAHTVESALIVDTAESMAAIKDLVAAHTYDGLLLDLALKDSEGLMTLSIVRQMQPHLPVIVVSSSDGLETQARVRSMGARGFLSKSSAISVMVSAISVLLAGGRWFADASELEALHGGDAMISRLSPAQLRVMAALADGKPNKIIAHDLGIAEPTVKSHMSAIFRVLGVSNRSQAILALRQG